MKAHCLFEQSGTFKNEFKKLGVEAYDYDIQNEFGETDYQIDLFGEIERAFAGGASIFDGFDTEDVIFAFFPCTRFETKVQLWFRGENYGQKNWSLRQKLIKAMEMHGELHELYVYLCKLVVICIDKNMQMIIENPYTQPHYLTTYWCIRPDIIDKDRTENGDYYKKPTQYWFINRKPKMNFIFEPLDYVEQRVIKRTKKGEGTTIKTERSMIHPQYASRFIRQYILEET